jgi:hypothetical protein
MPKLFSAALLALAAPAWGTPPIMPPPPPAAPPALTVVVRVEGLTSALFERYRGGFTGGLARVAGGTAFTLADGTPPLFAADRSLAASLKAGRPGSRMLVVAGSDATLAALGDPQADQRWLFRRRGFEQQTAAPPPPVAAAGNATIAKAIETAQQPLVAPPSCATPPFTPSDRRFVRPAGDVGAFVASPQMDGSTLAFAAAMARDLGLGSTSRTADVVAIGLGATGAVAAAHGVESQDLCLSLLSLDRDLGDYSAFLDRSNIDYAVVLAGSGSGTAPLLFWRKGWTAAAAPGPAKAADVAPTIATMLGAPIAGVAGGSCLDGLPGVICPPR